MDNLYFDDDTDIQAILTGKSVSQYSSSLAFWLLKKKHRQTMATSDGYL